MIAVIRIAGQIGIPKEIKEALWRLNIRRKYSMTLLKPTNENLKLLKKIRNFVAYGDIEKDVLIELLKKRGKMSEGEMDAEKIAEKLETRTLKELKVKPFFRLHPPRKGIDSKKHFGVGKGVLGDNKKAINDLIRRML